MPTVNQLIRKGRKPVRKGTKAPALHWVQNSLRNRTKWGPGCPQAAGRLHPGAHHDSEEAQLGAAENLPRQADQRGGSNRVHRRRRP